MCFCMGVLGSGTGGFILGLILGIIGIIGVSVNYPIYRKLLEKGKSKYFNTALKMDEALIAILQKKSLEYITVKEICEKAGVNRSTFYLHYETILDRFEMWILQNKGLNRYEILISKLLQRFCLHRRRLP